MRKIKIALITTAVIVSIGGAFASRPRLDPCELANQYRLTSTGYKLIIGVYGYNYYCVDDAGVCTYYKPNPSSEIYYPCRWGLYTDIPSGVNGVK